MRRRCVLCLLPAVLFAASCDSAEQGRSTDALVIRSDEGFSIEIPSCGAGGIGGFNLSPGGSRWLELRSNPDRPAGNRVVRLSVSRATLTSHDFGPEVKLLAADGAPFTSPGDVNYVRLNTDVGYVEFDPRKLTFSIDGRSIVHGKKSRAAGDGESGALLLAKACG